MEKEKLETVLLKPSLGSKVLSPLKNAKTYFENIYLGFRGSGSLGKAGMIGSYLFGSWFAGLAIDALAYPYAGGSGVMNAAFFALPAAAAFGIAKKVADNALYKIKLEFATEKPWV